MTLDLVTENLLTVNKINYDDLYCILTTLSVRKINYADLYFQSIFHESLMLENKIIKKSNFFIDQGVGVRVISKETTGFSYTNEINLNNLRKSIKLSQTLARSSQLVTSTIEDFLKVKYHLIYTSINPLTSLNSQQKIEILHLIDKTARAYDSRVVDVNAVLMSTYEQILIATTDGVLTADIRPLVSVSIKVIVEANGKREQGYYGGSRRTGYNVFFSKHNSELMFIEELAKEAARIAIINLSAIDAPSGCFPVILGPGWPGVLLHEAIGHGLEGDFNRKKTSVFSNKLGKKVASDLCTVVDDGTITARRGSLNIDDEGVPSQYNILIEKGVLKGYLQDKFNAGLMNMKSTGNARRESYKHLPMPRMTNTYMLPGISNPSDIIHSVDFGIYAPNFSGGQVDITSGNFVFSTSEAYLIKKGKLVNSIKNVMLIGSGLDVMKNISMVGNDLLIDEGVGFCIKEGQSIPVGVGQPTIKIDCLTVGGTVQK
ncbi:metalloprotease TldD [Buchnera aphidicola (Hormaphis cornu)]|nr:metalloprotease TldD [Buchnera aphidicola (Hormaphis cornu)]